MPAKMKSPPAKKSNNVAPSNPYKKDAAQSNPYKSGLAMRLKGSPIKMGQSGYSNLVFTTKTLVEGIYVSWTTSSNGKGASYIKPMVEYFNENGAALNLSELWGGTYGFAKRRIYNPENPLEDVPMPGKAGANWHWDAIVTVTDSNEATPASVGRTIAEQFEKFTEEQKKHFDKKQTYKFGGDATDTEQLPPLSKLLRNEDIIALFLGLFGNQGKEKLLEDDQLLESFFGDAETAKDLLEFQSFV